MKRTIVMLALGFLAAAAMAAGESPAAVQNLADRHIARGLKCESCHADAAHPRAGQKREVSVLPRRKLRKTCRADRQPRNQSPRFPSRKDRMHEVPPGA